MFQVISKVVIFKGCAGIVFTHGRWEKVCLCYISEAVSCRMLKLGGDIGWGVGL